MKELRIFYSWQSDLPSKCNRDTIRDILKNVKSNIEKSYNGEFNIIIDEATRGEVGSPNIPQTIINKISKCDIFIADVSIINNENDNERKVPNPNVMFELGFAVARLGWNRITPLFNTEFGKVEDLPFDIDRHRMTTFKIHDDIKEDALKSKVASYSKEWTQYIQSILGENPKKPVVIPKKLNKLEKERKSDISKIKLFMSSINIEVIDTYVKNLPYSINDDIFYFYNELDANTGGTNFHLYNKELYDHMANLYISLRDSLEFDEYYKPSTNSNSNNWDSSGIPEEKCKEVLEELKKHKKLIRSSLTNIHSIIREDYIEIKIDKINKKSYKNYLDYKKQSK